MLLVNISQQYEASAEMVDQYQWSLLYRLLKNETTLNDNLLNKNIQP